MALNNSTQKVLIIQTAFLGDVVLATALGRSIEQQNPGIQIDFMVRKGNQGVLDSNKGIKNIYIWDKKKKWSSFLDLLRTVRKRKYDTVFVLQRFTTMSVFALLSGAKIKVSFKSSLLSVFFHHKFTHQMNDPKHHEIDRNLQMLRPFFKNVQRLRPYIYIDDIERHDKEEYITIAPASVWFTKQFPKEKWAEFINSIQVKIKIYLIGSDIDSELISDIIRLCPQQTLINLAGKLSLRESASLMKYAKMNYVNDSAPLHLASAVDAPVTAVFCSTVPSFGFGPLSTDQAIIETEVELGCRPCGLHGHKNCPEQHFDCAHKVPVKKLVERI